MDTTSAQGGGGYTMKTTSSTVDVARKGVSPFNYFMGKLDDIKIRRWSDQ